MSVTEMNKTLTLVVVGYDVNGGTVNFKKALENKKVIKEKGFNEGKFRELQPPQAAPFPISYITSNNHLLTVEYNFIERKLIITQRNYRENGFNHDSNMLEVLKSLLNIVPSDNLTAFGLNYNTDVLRDEKLCLFNPKIETELGQGFWDTNIGFRTELAFQSNEYTSMYRIFKNEKLSEEKQGRYYSFDANFNFDLSSEDNGARILEIFKDNDKYYSIYSETIENILNL